ncbi:MAG: hypothetical protein ACJ8M4_03440 [Chthoniobacterales bacterium]
MKLKTDSVQGSTLVVVISVVALLLVFLGMAVEYTGTISRESQRSRKTALAMEIADGHLEMLFSSWRNIYRSTWRSTDNNSGGTDNSALGTNYFFTSLYNPGPSPTAIPFMVPAAVPDPIPSPPSTNFPSGSNYQLTQYRIQAVDPMITLDANENALKESSFGSGSYAALSPSAVPPVAYGPNKWQYSYFYLASVDVTVPSSTGDVKAKVRRVFEKKFDTPWTYAMFYNDDLEFQPSTAFSVNGPVHTNGSLYIGTSNFTATSTIDYSSDYVNGYAASDTYHTATPSKPNFAKSDATLTYSDMPPAQVSPYLPFGWNVKLSTADTTTDNDSYHDLIEQASGSPDPLSQIRLYNQACYRVLIDSNNNITVTKKDGTPMPTDSGVGQIFSNAITTNQAIQDQRENKYVRLATLDISQIRASAENGDISGWNGIIYIADTTPHGQAVSSPLGGTGSTVSTTMRAIRLKNGYRLPVTFFANGLTVVSANAIYIKGNYNTSNNSGDTVPSNNGTYTSPTASGYTRKLAAVIGDAVNVLSGAWSDTSSTLSISSRTATNTTVNAAIVSGIVPSSAGNYSGGGENFVRLLEDWKNNTLCIYGSMVELWTSTQATGPWTGAGNNYKSPLTTKFYWDTQFGDKNVVTLTQTGPPGNLQLAAYLQQQRWYQVY